MANLVGKLIIDEWYKMLTLAGFAVLILALTVDLKVDNSVVALFSLSALLIGIGELANHRYVSVIQQNPFGLGAMTAHGRPRRVKPMGVVFWIAGLVTLALGIYRAFHL